MSASGFIGLHRGDEAQALLEKHPNAFLLLTQIALRARWKDCPITGLKQGEALIGDWKKAGLHSPKAYQVAKERLEKCKLATFQGGNRGTRATLTNSTIFSLSAEDRGKPRDEQRGNKGEAGGKLGGTNNTDTRKTPKQKRASLEDVCSFCTEIEIPTSDGEYMFHNWESNGWTKGGKPVKNWKSQIRSWKSANYLPSQKANGQTPPPPAGTVIVNGRTFKP